MSVLFYGDPHGTWQPLFDAVAQERPEAVVLMGDMDLDEPLDAKLAPLLDAGIDVRWIPGNHDSEGDNATAFHDRLFHAGRGLDQASLHARIADVGGLRIAGLGGVFRGKVWNPKGEAPGDRVEPAAETREGFVARISKQSRWRGGVPLKHQTTIFPEDVDALRAATAVLGGADILVTHEAPSTDERGFALIDQVAREVGARLIVHGHLHHAYASETTDGICVRELARAPSPGGCGAVKTSLLSAPRISATRQLGSTCWNEQRCPSLPKLYDDDPFRSSEHVKGSLTCNAGTCLR